MKSSMVIITALEQELNPGSVASRVPVIYSGIGKVNASIATLEAIQKYQPSLIINFGTVGRINKNLSGLVPIGKVLQRDMMAEPLAPRGRVPFSHEPHEILSHAQGYTCGTGDSFVTQADHWLSQNAVDVVDMELYAIASVARKYNIPWLCWKYISDEANESSGHEWSKQVNRGEEMFLQELVKL
jgi:adenosylhomocysteine nucleosidase